MSLGTLLERMFVSIQADLSGLTDELDDAARDVRRRTEEISQRFNRMGQSMGRIGRYMSVGVTLPLLAVAKSAISTASEVEEMQSKFDTVFGTLAGDVTEWSSTTARELNRSRFDLMEYAASFQDTFVPMGFARDQAAELSKQVTELGVDLASFNNIAESDAMASLQSALIGNHETVRRFGVIITAATLDAELMRMGIEGGSRAASEQDKIMARLNLILRGTSDAHGDAARTADGFANQMRGLQAQMREASAVIGQVLLPVATQLVGWVTDMVSWFNQLDPKWQSLIVKALALAAAIGPVLIALGFMVQALAPVLAAVTALLSPWILLTAAVVAAGVMIYRHWDKIKEEFPTIAAIVEGAIETIKTVIVDSAARFMEWVSNIEATLRTGAELISAIMSGEWSDAWDLGIELVKSLFDTLFAFFDLIFLGLPTKMKEWATSAIQALVDGFLEKMASVREAVSAIWTTITETVTGWFDSMYALGASLIQKFIDGAISMIPGIAAVQDRAAAGLARNLEEQFGLSGSGVTNEELGITDNDLYNLYGITPPGDRGYEQGTQFGEGVEQGVKDALEIRSPSKVMKRVGEEVMNGLRGALENSGASVRELSEGLADQIAEPFLNSATEMSNEFDVITDTMQSHIEKFIQTGKFNLGQFVTDITGSWLQDAIGNFSEQITNIIMEAFTGLAGSISGGIGGSGGGLFSALGSIFNGLFGGFRAGGGVVPPWKSFVAGERGAEMIEQDGPAGARRVSTAGRTAAMGGGRIHVSVSGARGNAEIRDMVNQGVREGIGTYDKSVGSRVRNNLGRRE